MLMSICSKRLSYLVKLGRYQLHDLLIHLKPGKFQIIVIRNSKDACGIFFNSKGNVPKGCDSLSQWFKNGKSNILNFTATDSIEDVFSVCNRLRSDFRVPCFFWRIYVPCFFWRIYPGELEDRKLKEMISTLDFDNCTKLYMIGGKLNTSTLSFLFDRMDSRMGFKTTSEIPWNFKHPRALDFYEIKYEDARWLTVNDLKTIRNGSWVDLTGRTNFDNHDMNQLIKYWTECEEKMFTQLRIKLKDGIGINMSRILKGVVSCTSGGGGRCFYRSKTPIGTHSIGSVEFEDGLVTLTSWPLKRSKLGYMVPILKLLEQHSDLLMNYSELIKKERELQSRLQNEQEQNELVQELLEIEAEKRNVETEFYDTVKQLKIRQITHFDEHLEPIA